MCCLAEPCEGVAAGGDTPAPSPTPPSTAAPAFPACRPASDASLMASPVSSASAWICSAYLLCWPSRARARLRAVKPACIGRVWVRERERGPWSLGAASSLPARAHAPCLCAAGPPPPPPGRAAWPQSSPECREGCCGARRRPARCGPPGGARCRAGEALGQREPRHRAGHCPFRPRAYQVHFVGRNADDANEVAARRRLSRRRCRVKQRASRGQLRPKLVRVPHAAERAGGVTLVGDAAQADRALFVRPLHHFGAQVAALCPTFA